MPLAAQGGAASSGASRGRLRKRCFVTPFLVAFVGGVLGGIASGLVISLALVLSGRRVAEGLLRQQVCYMDTRIKENVLEVALGRIASSLDQVARTRWLVQA